MLAGAGHLRPDLPLEPDAGGICHRCGVPFGRNRRYLDPLAALDDVSAGLRAPQRLTRPRTVGDRTVKGVNFFAPGDSALPHALQVPKVNSAGIRRGDLLPRLSMFSPGRLSRE